MGQGGTMHGTIKTRLYAMVGLIIVCFSLFIGLGMFITAKVKVNGPAYQEIVRGKDLIADILPPPEYIIESYLVTLQALGAKDADQIKGLQERLSQLRKDYDSRHEFWLRDLPEGNIKKLLLDDSYTPAVAFYDLAQKEFFPLLAAGNREQAHKVSEERLQPLYDAHRKAIDEIVTLTNAQNSQVEKQTAQALSRYQGGLLLAGFLLLGGILMAFMRVIRTILASLDMSIRTSSRFAEGDLSVDVAGTGAGCDRSLVDSLALLQTGLSDIVTTVKKTALLVKDGSNTQFRDVETISGHLEDVAGRTLSISAAAEEFSATSATIAGNCDQAAHNSGNASTAAAAGVGIVQEAVTSIRKISDRINDTATVIGKLGAKSDQIGNIIATIEDIADQTNLLALNAAIEAARAGEQGRGFAVVADEVRALAERTTKATREIGEMIRAIQQETALAVSSMEEGVYEVVQGSEAVERSGASLAEILRSVEQVAAQIAEIATAAGQESATAGEISASLQQIATVVAHAQTMGRETADISAQVNTLASELEQQVSRFRLYQGER
ncbi:MAG: methyl-accepting chemotaxis protein [Geobacter sp.]|nr:methyl-accepting chemotaxis protein [Geobacter sp.]